MQPPSDGAAEKILGIILDVVEAHDTVPGHGIRAQNFPGEGNHTRQPRQSKPTFDGCPDGDTFAHAIETDAASRDVERAKQLALDNDFEDWRHVAALTPQLSAVEFVLQGHVATIDRYCPKIHQIDR
jgi:hypothetical protein